MIQKQWEVKMIELVKGENRSLKNAGISNDKNTK